MLPAVQSDCGHAANMPPPAQPAAGRAPASPPEDRRAGHDCYFWPVDRSAMVNRYLIRARMAEDIVGLIREHGDVDPIDSHRLIDLGWTEVQVRAHLDGALARAADLRRRELSDEAA